MRHSVLLGQDIPEQGEGAKDGAVYSFWPRRGVSMSQAELEVNQLDNYLAWKGYNKRFSRASSAGLVGGRISHRAFCGEDIDHEKLMRAEYELGIDRHEWSEVPGNGPVKSYIDIYPGGIQFKKESLKGKSKATGGGQRSEIAGFSKDSQNRLMSLLMRVKFDDYSAKGKSSPHAKAFFVTLTYSDLAPCLENQETAFDWPRVKRDVDAFGKRLKRLKDFRGMLWKMEIEPRKSGDRKGQLVPHFHCLVIWENIKRIHIFRKWLSGAWFSVVGSGDPAHMLAGTNAMVAYGGSTGKLFSYLGKYIGKTFSFEGVKVGRVWGIIAGKDLETGKALKNPLDLAEGVSFFTSDEKTWLRFIRRLRKWGKKSEYLKRLSQFQSAAKIYGKFSEMSDLIRDLDFMEYQINDFAGWRA